MPSLRVASSGLSRLRPSFLNTNPRVWVRAAVLFGLASAAAYTVSPASVRAGTGQDQQIRPLEHGSKIERELAGGETHRYQVTLAAGQYVRIKVNQLGIDVVVLLLGPDGVPLAEMDGIRLLGEEELSWASASGGAYAVEVKAGATQTRAGRYELKLEKWSGANEKDRARLAAERLFMEGRRAQQQGTGESLETSIGKYEEAVDSWRAAGERKWQALTLHNLGLVHLFLSRYDKSKDYYNQALAIRREIKDKYGEGLTLTGLGRVHENLNQIDTARDYHEQSLAIWREIRDRRGEGAALGNLGNVYVFLSQNEKARDYFEQALAISREITDRESEGSALNNLGSIYATVGQNENARDAFEKSLAIARELGDRRGEGNTLVNLGGVYESLSEYENARVYHEQSLTIFRELKDRNGEAATLQHLGIVSENLSQYERARDYYEQSLAIGREIKSRYIEETSLNGIGNLYGDLRQHDKSRGYYEQVLVISREIGDQEGEGTALQNLGIAWQLLGQYEKSRDYYEQALAIVREMKKRSGESAALAGLGAVYRSLGKHEQARGYYEQSLAVSREITDKRGEAVALSGLGDVNRSLSQNEKSRACYEQSIAITRDIKDRRGEIDVLFNLTSLEADLGNLLEARKRIESALAIVENLRASYIDQQLRSAYFAAAQNSYELYIDLLMRLHKQHPAAAHDVSAFQASERLRARILLETLAEAGADIREGVDPQLVARERGLQRRLNTKAQQQVKIFGPHAAEQASALAGEIDALTEEYQKLEAQIRRTSPRYASLTQPQPLSLEEIQQRVLDPNTVLVEYALGDQRSYLWAVTSTSVASYELPGRAEIEGAARRFYDLIKTNSEQANEAAATLSSLLLTPVASQLGTKRLLVVADGALQYIPFAALPVPAVSGGGSGAAGNSANKRLLAADYRPLIVDHEIISLPSASVLGVLRSETSGRPVARKTIAVIADPVFNSEDPRLKRRPAGAIGLPSQDTAQSRADSERLQRALREDGFQLSRLLGTRQEAKALLALAPVNESKQAFDFQASRATAMSAELGQYRLIHFATHGFVNSQHPELSGLVLSLVDEQGQSQDGFLRLHDIYNLKLPVELIVLSACQTGLGKEVRGEGLVGLTRGFMYAGAKRVVASMWKVDDKATAELMKQFYYAMLVEKRSPADAVRTAQLAVRGQKEWRSPYYWAAFVLQGEWK